VGASFVRAQTPASRAGTPLARQCSDSRRKEDHGQKTILIGALGLALGVGGAFADDRAAGYDADNTGKNVRDRDDRTATPEIRAARRPTASSPRTSGRRSSTTIRSRPTPTT
jgi:hypothetical protein